MSIENDSGTSTPRRVLIVRIGAMGDVLHAMPAVWALRRAHPECSIGWVIEPRWLPLLKTEDATVRGAGMQLVDHVYLAPTREWKKAPLSPHTLRDIARLRKELRRENYDLCIDMQGSIRSAIIGRMAGAAGFAGPAAPREAPAAWFYRQKIQTALPHVVDQGAELVSAALGETLQPQPIELPIDDKAEAEIAARLPDGSKIILIAPGAGWGAKRWPAERYGQVAAALAQGGYRVLVNAYAPQDKLANEVVQASGGRGEVFPCDMAELIALTRRASLVIAGDTGPLHLAAALERPVVALFGPTDPARNGPYGTASQVLRHGEARRDHKRHSAPEAGLLEITVDEVVRAASELLG